MDVLHGFRRCGWSASALGSRPTALATLEVLGESMFLKLRPRPLWVGDQAIPSSHGQFHVVLANLSPAMNFARRCACRDGNAHWRTSTVSPAPTLFMSSKARSDHGWKNHTLQGNKTRFKPKKPKTPQKTYFKNHEGKKPFTTFMENARETHVAHEKRIGDAWITYG
eukprot:SAG11_NODE_4585_length_1843_cov_1.861812_2_plen_167_part_00